MRKFSKQFNIGNFQVGDNRPFVIAELSGNHNQSFETAVAMIEAAAKAGVDAIKLQTYTADAMTLDIDSDDFLITEKDSLWRGENLHSLYSKAATPYEWHKSLFEYASSLDIQAFSSPFDEDAVDFLDELGVPCFKIASFELTDIPLIARAASKGKPLILSTGMASEQEIDEAIDTAYCNGCKDIVLLKCTSTYPASPENTNLATIPDMRAKFDCLVGLSDHTRGIGVSLASVAFGACVIEKHFVLDRATGGVDSDFSMEPQEFRQLAHESKRIHAAIGDVCYGGSAAEQESKKYRRSIYVRKAVAEGEPLTRDNLQIVRPSFGLAPKHWEDILGCRASKTLLPGEALEWSHFVKK